MNKSTDILKSLAELRKKKAAQEALAHEQTEAEAQLYLLLCDPSDIRYNGLVSEMRRKYPNDPDLVVENNQTRDARLKAEAKANAIMNQDLDEETIQSIRMDNQA